MYPPPNFEGQILISPASGEAAVTEEKCVICGGGTGIVASVPVKERKRYISGCGQLCEDCYYSLYLNTDDRGSDNSDLLGDGLLHTVANGRPREP